MDQLTSNVLIFAQKGAINATKLEKSLANSKSNVEFTYNTSQAVEYIENEMPCLIFFDTPIDDAKAIDLLNEITETKENLKINTYFLLDNNKNLESQIDLFDMGVDEFGTRDTSSILINRRVNNIINRYIGLENAIIPKNGLTIDKERYMVYKEDKEIFLPRKEFELLILLASKPHKVFTREEIFKLVWGNKSIVGDRTIDVHIRKIREKIGDKFIQTVKGVGYKFIG